MTEQQINALIGRRVRVVRWAPPPAGTVDPETGLVRDEQGAVISVDDNITVPPGTEGTVKHVDDAGTISVGWDNGTRLGLVTGQDEWVFA